MVDGLNRVKLSQMDALLLESLRSMGWSDEELLNRVETGDLPVDDSEYEFDYGQLAAFAAEHRDTFVQAVREGYQIKYNTLRGIRSWIWVALGLKAELELEPGKEAVLAALREADKNRLAAVLSFGWELQEVTPAVGGENAVYRIEPAQR